MLKNNNYFFLLTITKYNQYVVYQNRMDHIEQSTSSLNEYHTVPSMFLTANEWLHAIITTSIASKIIKRLEMSSFLCFSYTIFTKMVFIKMDYVQNKTWINQLFLHISQITVPFCTYTYLLNIWELKLITCIVLETFVFLCVYISLIPLIVLYFLKARGLGSHISVPLITAPCIRY